MTENKVVIKINYDKAKAKKPKTQAKMVTEWRVGRIAIVIVLVLSMVSVVTYLLMMPEQAERKDTVIPVVEKKIQHKQPAKDINTKADQSLLNDIEKKQEIIPVKTEVIEATKVEIQYPHKNENKTQFKPLIADERISRALLAKSLINKEPAGKVDVPIVADKNKAVSVIFFTEINNMKGEVLFHQWLRNEQVVFKRKLNILGKRWRASTSKLITYSGKGHWVVNLVDSEGNILSEIQFDVI